LCRWCFREGPVDRISGVLVRTRKDYLISADPKENRSCADLGPRVSGLREVVSEPRISTLLSIAERKEENVYNHAVEKKR
jgi:hypothetical protein